MVSISPGNTKMGKIPSVSLPALATCRVCACNKSCYALRIEKRRKNVHAAYQNNLTILLQNPDTYWREVEAAIMTSRFFRFHVSGDIPDLAYLSKLVEVAARNPHCQILCFTKKYELVNQFVCERKHDAISENLHIIFSAWVGLPMVNPFHFPEAHVRRKNGETTASPDARECANNCTYCAVTRTGCWSLGRGEQIMLSFH